MGIKSFNLNLYSNITNLATDAVLTGVSRVPEYLAIVIAESLELALLGTHGAAGARHRHGTLAGQGRTSGLVTRHCTKLEEEMKVDTHSLLH